MGSKTFDGVRFAAYVNDHAPPHLHGFYGEAEVILDLHFEQRRVKLSRRADRITPKNAKRTDVRKIVRTGSKHIVDLIQLWESAQ